MSIAWAKASFLAGWGCVVAIGVTCLAAAPREPRPVQSVDSSAATCVSCSLEALPRNPFSLTFFQGEPKKPEPERMHAGFQNCLRCHNSGISGQVELPGGIKLDLMKEQWVLYKEYPIWAKDDKHGQAYTVLLNKRSKEMAKLLGVAEVHRDRRCLACHTGFPLWQMPAEKDGLVNKDLAKNLEINLGVSCEGCHGQSGDLRVDNRVVLKGWNEPHQLQPTLPYEKTKPWRFLSPKEKSESFGFFDVRTPSSKTKLCVSCHIGDAEQGRVVTHEMYAAGHPPLPGFEVETFVAQMPKHWVEFSDKAEDVRKVFLQFTSDPLYRDKGYKKTNLHRSRSMLAGALMTAGEYLRLVGQVPDASVKSAVERPAWPELAVFDCYACHHDLKRPAWRQERKPPVGVPGRPGLYEWPFALAKIALKSAGADTTEMDAKLADVRQALAAKPFGKPSELAKPAQAAAAWFAAKAREMDHKHISRAAGVALLQEIARAASSETLDYDSARQLTWGFQIVAGELKNDYPNAKEIASILAPLGKETFLLNLRGGSKASTLVPGDKQARQTTEVSLETVLPFIARYEPAAFQSRFKQVAELLK